MLMESFVAVMAILCRRRARSGVYFAINAPIGVLGGDAAHAVETIRQWGFTIQPGQMEALAHAWVRRACWAGWAAPRHSRWDGHIFSGAFGQGAGGALYHFAADPCAELHLTTVRRPRQAVMKQRST